VAMRGVLWLGPDEARRQLQIRVGRSLCEIGPVGVRIGDVAGRISLGGILV